MSESTARTIEPMTPVDHLFFRGERDPARRPTMTALYLLDRTPPWDAFEDTFERVSREFLRWRQRVVEPAGGFGTARWVTDPDFDLTYHVRRAAVPAPGTFRMLLDLVEHDLMTPLDPARPLWQATLYEGLEGGRSVFSMKTSHAITDGLGGIQLNSLLFDDQPRAQRRPMPPRPLPEDVTPDELAQQMVRRLPLTAIGTMGSMAGGVGRVAGALLRSPRRALTDAAAYGSSLRRVLASSAPPSPLLAGRSLSRRVMWIELPLSGLKAAAKAADASLNDAYLAGLCGALRRYHERLGMPVEALSMAIPISVRTNPTEVGGNHFAGATLAAPIAETDVVANMRTLRRMVRAARAEPALEVMGVAAPILSTLPPPVMARFADSMAAPDVQASNVPGNESDQYLAGAQVETALGIGPLPAVAMMSVLFSNAGKCTVTINYDPAAVTDAAVFEACLRESFDELLALVPVPARAEVAAGRP
jgi:diacylglycerol O-acyltransferase